MNNEFVFRVIFWIIIFIILLFLRIIPAVNSRKTKTKLMLNKDAMKNEGEFTIYIRIILGALFFAFIIFYFINPPFMNNLHINIPFLIRWIGVFIATIGVILWIYSQSILSKYWSPQLQIQTNHKLIVSGIYKKIRHPIYSSMFIWCIGLALFTADIGWTIFSCITIIFLYQRVPREEKMMIEKFGDEYKKYMKTSGKFLPKVL